MDAATAITEFRTDASTDILQTPDATALIWLNRTYRDCINYIRQEVNEDYFYDEWKTNTIIGQREYTLLKRTSTVPGMVKIKGLSIKYTASSDYKKARPEVFGNLTRDLSWYETNQPTNDPFYIVSDNSYFVYPVPTEAVTEGIKSYGISDPIDLLTTSTESDIKIPLQYHYILPLGMLFSNYRAKNMINEKNDAKNEYFSERTRMIKNLSDRIITPLESEMPYIANLG